MRLSPQAQELLAREYALGTLHGAARRRFEALLPGLPGARTAVESWQRRLGRLAEEVPAIEPSPALWRGLSRQLFDPPAAAPARRGWRWLMPALGGAVAGALLCTVVLTQRPQAAAGVDSAGGVETLPPAYVGVLSDATGQAVLAASSTRHGRLLSLKLLRPLSAPAGQVARLWAFPADAAPFAVGDLPASGKAALALPAPAEQLFAKVSRLGVRFEPSEGLGTAPSAGELAISGPCVKVW
jgi:anti-sigma-K factor RskA